MTKNNLYRQQANYGQAIKNTFASESLLISNLRSVKFQYYYREGNEYAIFDNSTDRIPSGVVIEINYGPDKDLRKMTKLVNVPVGS